MVHSFIDPRPPCGAARAAILLLVASRPIVRLARREPVPRSPLQVVRPVVRRGPPLFA
jgi:hypothetical protein